MPLKYFYFTGEDTNFNRGNILDWMVKRKLNSNPNSKNENTQYSMHLASWSISEMGLWNQWAPLYLDHWAATIVFRSCQSHSNHPQRSLRLRWFHYRSTRSLTSALSDVQNWSSFSLSGFSFSSLSYSPSLSCCDTMMDVEGSSRLASLQLTVSVRSVTEQMKWKALDCLEAFFRSVCLRACRAQSSKPGQNVPWK